MYARNWSPVFSKSNKFSQVVSHLSRSKHLIFTKQNVHLGGDYWVIIPGTVFKTRPIAIHYCQLNTEPTKTMGEHCFELRCIIALIYNLPIGMDKKYVKTHQNYTKMLCIVRRMFKLLFAAWGWLVLKADIAICMSCQSNKEVRVFRIPASYCVDVVEARILSSPTTPTLTEMQNLCFRFWLNNKNSKQQNQLWRKNKKEEQFVKMLWRRQWGEWN